MAFCKHCGKPIDPNAKFCPTCGKVQQEPPAAPTVVVEQKPVNDAKDNMAMAILCYLGLLAFIPYFAEKNSPFVRFHAVQGMNLLIYEGIAIVALGILSVILSFILFVIGTVISSILNFAVWAGFIALIVIGIVNVCKGETKPLPIIDSIKIVKK